jgi:hypothetical protein
MCIQTDEKTPKKLSLQIKTEQMRRKLSRIYQESDYRVDVGENKLGRI